MAGKKHLDVLQERVDRLTAARAPNPIRDAAQRLPIEEIQRVINLYETDGPLAFATALMEHLNHAEE
ncbi:MAG: hypothetical protein LC676_09465 [Loktanella sp.]|nr:hypothetical protein [Loktanella sp.]